MTLIKPINTFLKEVKKDPAELSYMGIVEDNKDPEKLGRLRVRIAPYDDYETEDIPWACPILGSHGNSSTSGGVNVPEVGSQVRVVFPSKDMTAPYYTGAELNKSTKMTFFDEDYPATYGYKDSVGNFIKVNKDRKTVHLQHSSSTSLRVAPDGSVQVSLSNGAYFTFSNDNNFELDIDTVRLRGTCDGTLDIKANMSVDVETGSVRVKADSVEFTGDVSVGSGATGTFFALGNIVTVKNGIIVDIS